MHEPLVAAAISQSCRYVAILSGHRWAVLRAIMWHPTLLVPTLFSLAHTGIVGGGPEGAPGTLPRALRGPLAGALFPPLDTTLQHAASGIGMCTGGALSYSQLRKSGSLSQEVAAPVSPTMAHVSAHSPRTHDSSSHASTLSLVLWDAGGAAAVVDVRHAAGRSTAASAAQHGQGHAPAPHACASPLYRSGNVR